jgi:hypothetical protein
MTATWLRVLFFLAVATVNAVPLSAAQANGQAKEATTQPPRPRRILRPLRLPPPALAQGPTHNRTPIC